MNSKDFYTIVQERIAELPPITKEIVQEIDWYQKSLEILKGFELPIEISEKVAQKAMFVVVGIIKRAEFEKDLSLIQGIPDEFVYEILRTIDEGIFAELNKKYLGKTDPEALEVYKTEINGISLSKEETGEVIREVIPLFVENEQDEGEPDVKDKSNQIIKTQKEPVIKRRNTESDPYHEEITQEDLNFNPSFKMGMTEDVEIVQGNNKMSIPEYKRIHHVGTSESQRTVCDVPL